MDGDGSTEPQPEAGSLGNGLLDAAAANPLLAVIVTLVLVWGVSQFFMSQRSGSTLGGTAGKDEALSRAREVQQERMQRAAEARAAAPATAPPAPVVVSSQPSHLAPQAQPAKPKPATGAKSMAERLAKIENPVAQAQPAKPKPATGAKSMAERLAKIEKGKGPSAHNPLSGFGGSSSSSTVCR